MTNKNPDSTLIASDRLTSKEENFACLRASGTPQGDAYRQAYGCDGSATRTVAVEANRVESKPRVKRRILELRDAHASAVVSYTVAAAMSELDESMALAKAKESPMAMIKVVEVRMKLYGLGLSDAKHPTDRDEMTPEQLEAALADVRAVRAAQTNSPSQGPRT